MNKEIDAATLKKWINEKKDIELIDVRMPFEYKFKHIEVSELPNGDYNYFNIPGSSEHAQEPKKVLYSSKLIPLKEVATRLSEIDKSKPVVFICQSGGRSCMACEIAEKQGYETYNLKNGLMDFM